MLVNSPITLVTNVFLPVMIQVTRVPPLSGVSTKRVSLRAFQRLLEDQVDVDPVRLRSPR